LAGELITDAQHERPDFPAFFFLKVFPLLLHCATGVDLFFYRIHQNSILFGDELN
jgi:hypothetical protein